jgi:uncharacterized integral membrane protein
MGEYRKYQPLTAWDAATVVIYRAGIALAALLCSVGAYAAIAGRATHPLMDALIVMGYAAVGLSVFFIHLYVSRFHRLLKMLYAISLAALALLYSGGGGPAALLAQRPASYLLLLPLSGCLGFITAKEGFCFRIYEGYVLALLMPAVLLAMATGMVPPRAAALALLAVAAGLVVFALRKVFMPLHTDIGDKSAYG